MINAAINEQSKPFVPKYVTSMPPSISVTASIINPVMLANITETTLMLTPEGNLRDKFSASERAVVAATKIATIPMDKL